MSEQFSERWQVSVSKAKDELEQMHGKREDALRKTRSMIQVSSKCIRHIHRRQFEEAEELLQEAREMSDHTRDLLANHPKLMYAGYLQDAQKEVVEAAGVFAIVKGDPLPTSDELGVEITSYLNGMAEASSECRRYVLDEMRDGNLKEANRMLGQMQEIYDDLITFDYPDSLTGGLRRTTDQLRGVIERTRSDLTMTQVQHNLMEELKKGRSGG
jgi:translin